MNQSIRAFKSILRPPFAPQRSNRFKIEFLGDGKGLSDIDFGSANSAFEYLCVSVDYPTEIVKYANQSLGGSLYPIKRQIEHVYTDTLTMTFLEPKDLPVRGFFTLWIDKTMFLRDSSGIQGEIGSINPWCGSLIYIIPSNVNGKMDNWTAYYGYPTSIKTKPYSSFEFDEVMYTTITFTVESRKSKMYFSEELYNQASKGFGPQSDEIF